MCLLFGCLSRGSERFVTALPLDIWLAPQTNHLFVLWVYLVYLRPVTGEAVRLEILGNGPFFSRFHCSFWSLERFLRRLSELTEWGRRLRARGCFFFFFFSHNTLSMLTFKRMHKQPEMDEKKKKKKNLGLIVLGKIVSPWQALTFSNMASGYVLLFSCKHIAFFFIKTTG